MRILTAFILMLLFCPPVFAGMGMGPGPGLGKGGAATFSATDNFDRTNSDTLGTLSGGTYTWNEVLGDIDIETNAAHHNTSGDAIAVLNANPDRASGSISTDVHAEGSAFTIVGSVFWYIDASNYWRVLLSDNYGTTVDLRLEQVSGGVPTTIATGAIEISSSTTYNLDVVYGASAVSVYVNSTQYINQSGTYGSNHGNIGLFISRTGSVSGWIDNFEAL